MRKFLAVITISLFLLTCAASPHYQDKPHHTKKGFNNIYSYEKPSFLDFLKWRWSRLWKETPKSDDYCFPLANNDPVFLEANRKLTTLTWIGHATVLLQLEGNNILTDPHFSKRASPVQWAGPRRIVPPGFALKDLPPIDIVVISHDHYDSLDTQSIVKLYEREGGQKTTFFVPLGLKNWFEGLLASPRLSRWIGGTNMRHIDLKFNWRSLDGRVTSKSRAWVSLFLRYAL
jgi:hypothetical protein